MSHAQGRWPAPAVGGRDDIETGRTDLADLEHTALLLSPQDDATRRDDLGMRALLERLDPDAALADRRQQASGWSVGKTPALWPVLMTLLLLVVLRAT